MVTTLKSDRIYQRMVELRRNFHRYPELAFKEAQTANRLRRISLASIEKASLYQRLTASALSSRVDTIARFASTI